MSKEVELENYLIIYQKNLQYICLIKNLKNSYKEELSIKKI